MRALAWCRERAAVLKFVASEIPSYGLAGLPANSDEQAAGIAMRWGVFGGISLDLAPEICEEENCAFPVDGNAYGCSNYAIATLFWKCCLLIRRVLNPVFFALAS
jgi:hypothetical protein